MLPLLAKILPLYALIGIGFFAVKKLTIERESIARILIYCVVPGVVFLWAYQVDITVQNLSLPLLFFVMTSTIAVIFFGIAKFFYRNDDRRTNILSFMAASGNTGYFWLPLITLLVWPEALSITVLLIFGGIIFENTLGMWIIARGTFGWRESIRKIIGIPTLYAFLAGILFNALHIHLGQSIIDTLWYFRGAYSLLGMMIIGMGIATVRRGHIDRSMMTISFVARFLVWPIFTLVIVFINASYLHFYTPETMTILTILSLVPLAANSIALSIEFHNHPEEVALCVVVSTLIALVTIPIGITYLL